MATQKKIDTVKELTDRLTRAKTLVLADPAGLKHKQLEDLRKKLKMVEGEFTVAKNSLLKRALLEAKKTISEANLTGATATLFAYADEVAPLKELINFFKTAAAGKIKSGLFWNKEMAAAEIERLAALPTHDQLLSQLVGQLQAPLYGLHNALSWNLRKLVWSLEAVKKTKSDTTVSS